MRRRRRMEGGRPRRGAALAPDAVVVAPVGVGERGRIEGGFFPFFYGWTGKGKEISGHWKRRES